MNEPQAPPLTGIRVLDLTDGFGAYAGRLLAGLGAEVRRARRETEEGVPLLSPHAETDEGTVSLFDEWVHAGKTPVDLEVDQADDHLEALIRESDVLLTGADDRPPGAWSEDNPTLVHVVITPFGWGLSPDWSPVDDLIVLGAGGLLHLGGYPDIGPVGAFGHQSLLASGIFGAVAALVGLLEREETGEGNTADVSAQEAIAQALEDSLPAYTLTGVVREPRGEEAREAGTGVYACSDGHISMVAGRLGTARAWNSLVAWLSEETAEAEELKTPVWSEFSFRQTESASDRFREIFEGFAATKTKEDLYVAGQRRGIAISPVSSVTDLIGNEQLNAREFFVDPEYPRLGTKAKSPGAPYRLSGSAQIVLDGMPGHPRSAQERASGDPV